MTLPAHVKVTITLQQPWRDYRSLRGATAPFETAECRRRATHAVLSRCARQGHIIHGWCDEQKIPNDIGVAIKFSIARPLY